MTTKKTVVENSKPLADIKDTPSDNGVQPEGSPRGAQPEIEKAITLVELQKDLANLNQGLANLQRQVLSQMGAIQYIQQKIADLTKVAKSSD